MKRKYLAAVLLTAFLADATETATALELSQYNKLNTVSRIVNDSEVTDLLRKALDWPPESPDSWYHLS